MLTDAVSKAVLVSAPEGLFVFDREGRIVFVNSQIDELFGYAPGELLGQSLEVLLPVLFWEMREHQSAASALAPGLPTEPFGLEHMGYRKDRAEIRLEGSVGHVDAHDQPWECCIVRQIAAPEPQDQTLSGLNDHFRQMVENSHDILTIRDADGRVRYTSPSIHGVLGYKQEEIIGSTCFELIHPEDRSTVENALNEFWKNHGARGSIQYRAKHANGTWVSLEVVAYNLLDHPAVRGVVINGRDISQRKQEEAGKDQMIAELQQTLANVKTLTGVLPICASCKKIKKPATGSKSRPTSAIAPRSSSPTPCAPNARCSGIRSTAKVSRCGSLFTWRRERRRPTFHFRRHGNRTSAILAHRAHCKEMIVRGHAFQNRFTGRSRKVINSPARIAGLAPQNLERCALRIIVGSPRHFRIRRDGPC